MQSASVRAPSELEDALVIAIKGIGPLRASCFAGFINLSLRNQSGKELVVTNLHQNEAGSNPGSFYSRTEIANGNEESVGGIGATEGAYATDRLSIFPSGTASQPQAELIVNVEHGCDTAQISALALHTEP